MDKALTRTTCISKTKPKKEKHAHAFFYVFFKEPHSFEYRSTENVNACSSDAFAATVAVKSLLVSKW